MNNNSYGNNYPGGNSGNRNGSNWNQSPYLNPMVPTPMQGGIYSVPHPTLADMNNNGTSQLIGIPGKIINAVDDIRPNDVNMDGRVHYFPLSDLSMVVGKQWNANGTIDTCYYIPVKNNNQNQQGNIDAVLTQMAERLDRIEKAVSRNNRQPKFKKNYTPNEAPVNKEEN